MRSRGSAGASLDLATSVVPYLVLLVAMAFALHVSVWLSLALVVPAAGFLTRTFIVFHDCTHGSFMRSRRANDVLGVALGLLVWLPYRGWQHEHAVHHATAGDLDRRGVGDVATLTVAEYQALPRVAAGQVPALPQPARHVRPRLAPRARAEAALRAARGAAAVRNSVLGDEPRARADRRRGSA